MTAVIVLDAGPLGLIVNTNPENPEAIECATWLQSLLRTVFVFVSPRFLITRFGGVFLRLIQKNR